MHQSSHKDTTSGFRNIATQLQRWAGQVASWRSNPAGHGAAMLTDCRNV